MKMKKLLALLLALTLCISVMFVPSYADEDDTTAAAEVPVEENTVVEDSNTESVPEPQPVSEPTPTPEPTAQIITDTTNVPTPDNLTGLKLSPTYDIDITGYKESNNCKYYATDTGSFVLVVGNYVNTNDCRIVFRSSVVNSGYTDSEDYVAESYFANNICNRYGGIFIWYTSLYTPEKYPNPSEYEYEEYGKAIAETIATLKSFYGITSYKFETCGYSGGDMAALHLGAQLGADTILITDLHAQGNDEEWPLTLAELSRMAEAGTLVVDVRSDGIMETDEMNRLEEQLYINGVDVLMIYVHGTIAHGAVHRWIFDYTNIPLVVFGLENIMLVSESSPYSYFAKMYQPLESPTT